jgi:type III secretory pathway component EscR
VPLSLTLTRKTEKGQGQKRQKGQKETKRQKDRKKRQKGQLIIVISAFKFQELIRALSNNHKLY